MSKALDSGGLGYLLGKFKAWATGAFAPLSHTHTASEAPGSVTGVKGNVESSYRTGDVNLTPANIGAVAKSGDTMTGMLTLKSGQYTDDYTTGALDLQNSNIQGVNSIYTGDASEDAAEGIHFYRDSTHVDSIHAKSGQLYFTPNRALGSAGTSEKVLRETSPLKESLLTWGGKNFSASYGPIDAAMIGELGANRLAFSKAAGISIEYTRDGGTTWIDYGWPDAYKVDLFAKGRGLPIGKYAGASELGQVTTNWKVRVTLTTTRSGTYTVLNKFAFYVTTNGAYGSYVTITARKKSDLDADNDTWVTIANQVPVAGWSGWNIVNYPSGVPTHGNSASQYANIRFEFGIGGLRESYNNALSINRIMGFGGVGWSVPSNMAADGHLYSYDGAQNATFPAKVTATGGFSGALTGNVTGNVTGDVTGNLSGNISGSRTATGSLKIGNNTQGTIVDAGIVVNDVRNATLSPSVINQAANFYFMNSGMPTAGTWYSLLHVKGWTDSYSAWELAGPANNSDQRTRPLYVRTSNGSSSWGDWRQIFDSAATIPIANGGTGATTAAAAWTALGGGAIGKKASLVASDIPAHAASATTYGAGDGSNYGHVKLSAATNSSSGTSGGIAATPSAVKSAYDLANTANTTANGALSVAQGALVFDTTYSISNGTATFSAHVYQGGEEVTSDYADADFAWYYRLGTTASTVSLGTGKTKAVTITTLGYGGSVGCIFDDGYEGSE